LCPFHLAPTLRWAMWRCTSRQLASALPAAAAAIAFAGVAAGRVSEGGCRQPVGARCRRCVADGHLPLTAAAQARSVHCDAARGPPAGLVRIEAGRLIPGRGEPIRDGVVVLDGRRIAYAGPAAGAPATDGAEVFRGAAVMPGMWDCHTHFIGCRDSSKQPVFDEVFKTSGTTRALRCVAHAAKLLDAGFTSVREVGGMGDALATAIADGSIRGPHVYFAGDILSTTGGHGDMHEVSLESYQACPHTFAYLCDGIPECLKGVRTQLRKGASVIKICASGGVMSKVDDPIHQQFSDEELKAICDEAHRAEVNVAAHCHGKAGILAALRAGVDTIEHGTHIDDECIDLMLQQGAMLVPTRWIFESLKQVIGDRKVGDAPPPGLDQWQADKLVLTYHDHKRNVSAAIKRGVKVAVGCDIFVAEGMGHNGRELEHLTGLGMTPLQAIEAATANGAETLGPLAPKTGVLVVGWDADVILLSEDPLLDIRILGEAKNVTHVWKAGALVKPFKATQGPHGKAYAAWDQA